MQLSISKKDIIYSSLIVLLILFGVFNQSSSQVKSEQETNLDFYSSNGEDRLEEDMQPVLLGTEANLNNIPHLYCQAQALYTDLPTSNEYNSDYEFPAYMMGNGTYFQDINGDGLVDYIYNNSTLQNLGSTYEAKTRSCAYLNNGSSWSRASICSASTEVNITTGDVVEAEYKGDCAGEPSVKQEN